MIIVHYISIFGILHAFLYAIEIYLGFSILGLLYLSIIPKINLLIILYNLKNISNLLIFIGICSLIIGCIGGINQNNIKLILLYSSINQIGIICID